MSPFCSLPFLLLYKDDRHAGWSYYWPEPRFRAASVARKHGDAGNRVPTVRHNAERELRAWHEAGADVRLIRINPELPFGDHPKLKPGGKLGALLISILMSPPWGHEPYPKKAIEN